MLVCCVFLFVFFFLSCVGLRVAEHIQRTNKWRRLWGQESRSRKMGTTKYDIEKFLGENDFGLWRIKMEAILIQHGCAEALKGEEKMSESLSSKEKSEMIDRARSAIILCLGDKALREVARERTTTLI